MSKPSDEELEIALKTAADMRDNKTDSFFIAKALLNYNYRFKYLEEVLRTADLYINHGMSDQEHSHLIRAIEKAKEVDSYTSHQEATSFGLE